MVISSNVRIADDIYSRGYFFLVPETARHAPKFMLLLNSVARLSIHLEYILV